MSGSCEVCGERLAGRSVQKYCSDRCKAAAYRARHRTEPRLTEQERFWVKVEVRGEDECWPWLASLNTGGYGQFKAEGVRSPRGAHVMAYEYLVGPVPPGHDLDHLCENPPCVNPRHLEPKTSREHGTRHLPGARRDQSGRFRPRKDA